MISIIHPSRSRVRKALKTKRKWIESYVGKWDYEWILSLDNDDIELEEYRETFSSGNAKIIVNANRSAIDAINEAAKLSKGDMLMVVSDDTDCFLDWNGALERYLIDRRDFIIKTNDGTQPWIITNPIMDRTYYNRFGYIYHPEYKHMFCDTELTCVADLTGRKITSNLLFKHNHYSVTKEPPDAISKRADGTWDQGEKLFLERYKRNFDLPPDQIKGKIQDNGMINWLKRKIR